MGQTNSKRVSHNVTSKPSVFRDDTLKQVIDDIEEELFDKGYVEVAARTGVFIDQIDVWDTSSKTLKRADLTFSRSVSPPFIDECVMQVYDEADGTTVVSTTTITITRDGNKQITSIDSVTTRP